MTTDTVKCSSCYNYTTPGHTYCESGCLLLGASEEVKNQVPKNVINCCSILKTSAFVSKTGAARGKTIGRSDDSQWYHKACDHNKSVVTKKSIKTFRAISDRRLVSKNASVRGYNRGKGRRVGPCCRRTEMVCLSKFANSIVDVAEGD